MSGTYQANYNNELIGGGREIRIADECMSYYYRLAEGDTIEDAIESFAASYDYNLDPGQDPRDVEVGLCVEEYLDGEEVGFVNRTISPQVE